MKYLICLLLTIFSLSFTSKNPDTGTLDFCLYVFEGSDWCVNCKRLEEHILKDSVFTGFLISNKINLVRVDFPQRKKISAEQQKENKLLAVKYKFEGIFPSVILSRTDSLIYEKIIYQNQNPDEFSKQLLTVMNKLHK